MRYYAVRFHATDALFYLDTFCRLCLIALLLHFAQLIAGTFLYPLLLMWYIQILAFTDTFEALKA
jgi:hypothetical protein